MIRFVSKSSSVIYRYIGKPILFRFKPDFVHNRMLSASHLLQKSGAIRALINSTFAYRDPCYLAQTINGIDFTNPVGLSAGFDKNFEMPPMLKSFGFGFMEGGSLTFHACKGNPRPWFYRLPKTKSLVINAGLANQGVKAIIKRIQSYPAETFDNFPLNISVAKTNSREASSEKEAIADYIASLQEIKKTKVGQLITLNISCPNTYGGEPFTTPQKLERLLKAVDEVKMPQPIFIKMPANLSWEEFDGLLKVIIKHRVAGVTISNLTKDRTTNVEDVLPNDVPGKLSGKPTFELSNKNIAQTYKKYGNKLTIIGVGGIFSAEDAYTKIKLGASLVELITGMVFEGPQLIGQINQGLAGLLKKDGLSNISEAIGRDNPRD